EREGVLGGAGGAVEVHPGAEAKEQVVVADAAMAGDLDLTLRQVDARDLALGKAPALAFADQLIDRRADTIAAELVGRDLVEQRQEGVVVVAVDERDIHRRATQLAQRGHAGKAGAENNDLRPLDQLLRAHQVDFGISTARAGAPSAPWRNSGRQTRS